MQVMQSTLKLPLIAAAMPLQCGRQYDGAHYSIYANRFDGTSWFNGTSWGMAELIESDNAGNAEYPQIAFDSSGNAIAVWTK